MPARQVDVYVGSGNEVTFTSASQTDAGPPPYFRVRDLFVGDNSLGGSSSAGVLNVTSGKIQSIRNAAAAISVASTAGSNGTVNVNGGTLEGAGVATGMIVGAGANSNGFLNVSDGSLSLSGALQLGVGTGATGTMAVSGGTVSVATGPSSIVYIGSRVNGAATGIYTQSNGVVDVADAGILGVGFTGAVGQNATGAATITGGALTANVRVGRAAASGGGGSGTLTIGSGANVTGRSQAWELSGTGEIVFQLGVNDTFNAVNLTLATDPTAFSITEAGAVITVDGSNLAFSMGYSPISMINYASGKAPTALSQSNVTFNYVGFDPGFTPTLSFTATSLQLDLVAVPEPTTTALIAIGGLLGLVFVWARRRREVV